jgi:hypothetical protein
MQEGFGANDNPLLILPQENQGKICFNSTVF